MERLPLGGVLQATASFALLVLSAAGLQAQPRFEKVSFTKQVLPGAPDFVPALALDVDGDSFTDLISGRLGFVAYGRGGLDFGEPIRLPTSVARAAVTEFGQEVGDLNGDGLLDLVYLGATDQIEVVLATGPRTYQASPVVVPGSMRLAGLGDYDGDGDLDIYGNDLLGTAGQVFLNDGAGGFSPMSSANLWAGLPYVVADLDADGDADVVTATPVLPLTVYENVGGRFVAQAGAFTTSPGAFLLNNPVRSVHAADVDGDGDLDLFGHSQFGFRQIRAALFENTGSGFVSRPIPNNPGAFATFEAPGTTLGDFDGDGVIDLAVYTGVALEIYYATGAGQPFVYDPPVRVLDDSVRDRESRAGILFGADLDRDGAEDPVVTVSRSVVLGQTIGQMVPATEFFLLPESSWLARDFAGEGYRHFTFRDLTGDGLVDLLQFDPPTQLTQLDRTTVLPQVERGRFLGFDTIERRNVPSFELRRFADFDGDGRDEVLMGGDLHRRFNQFELRVAGDQQQDISLPVSAIVRFGEVGDFDDDGDPDILFHDVPGDPKWYRNDGSRSFTLISAFRVPPPSTMIVRAVGDMDADGDEDVVMTDAAVAQLGPGPIGYVGVNEGVEGFSTYYPIVSNRVVDVQFALVGDLDCNGFPEILAGSTWFEFDGVDRFVESQRFTDPLLRDAVQLFDVEGDGDLDVLTSRSRQPSERLLLNGSCGVFSPSPGLLPDRALSMDPREVEFVDIDGDRDLDVLITYSFLTPSLLREYRNEVHLNQHIEIEALGLVRIGRDYEVRLSVADYEASQAVPAVLGFAPSVPSMPLQAGAGPLLLEPPIVFFPMMLPALSGATSKIVSVPNDPALVGGQAAIQGAIAFPRPNGFEFRLTALLRETIGS